MKWAIFFLSLIELAVVHIFVALKWPWIGWPLTIISAIGAVWLLVWIFSMKRTPHCLRDEQLVLRRGNMKTIVLELSNISNIRSSWEQGATDAKGTINLAGIAYPNRCFDLVAPIEKGKTQVFARFDDPQAFDDAVKLLGFEVA